ncbi:probable phospholipid-transporting ATPase IM isoform X3 [Daphnia pulex]|uniref:probable phospholipid-transporting ATPase IM isoform X3 n=1 Tax=Daphnia pulex TaxID=6669 RepID=UPI001EDCF8CE|nr:probable phospholipid-transporting ATPase IM isoform X3 [Daphnia pulex]
MWTYPKSNQTTRGSRSRSAEAMGTPSLDGSQGKGRRILPSLRRISTTPLKPRRRSSSSSSESSCPSPPPAPKQPARPSPLRSAAVAAARKTRRFFGAKSNDILPENERRIRANDAAYNLQFNYSNNYIQTSKYTLLSFVPVNLIEQFQRLANFYFLCLLVLQFIPFISSLTPVTTAVPLIGVLLLTAIKDAYDDFQRHRSDSQVNNRKSHVLRNGKSVEERWHKVQVGDIIRMENDQFIAADLLLLTTSEPNGLCYIETAELDGETNLKCRQCLMETAEMGQNEARIGSFNGEIICEPPNNHLNKFDGRLTWNGKQYSLDNEKILLRGCVLRNTQWCYGVVIFAGRDTKLMQNSGKTKFKRTSIDRLLNFIILGIVFFLLSMCLFCTIACGVWETVTGQYFRSYLPWDPLIPAEPPAAGSTVIALLIFFSYAIVLNTVVPISLYVSVEVIRLAQSFLINWDQQMYYEKSQTPAKARTTTLNEELGQIEYIFSDKTGTLTQNIMSFNKCSIGGTCYGDVYDSSNGEVIDPNENTKPVDFSFNPLHEQAFKFYDQTLIDSNREDPTCHEFFRLLALCHTVMPDEKNGKLEYQAQSPDEGALVSAARNFGFVFKARTPDSITIEVMGKTEVYELLCILDFNNVRKRMSVILRGPNGKIRLYCKGADSIVYDHLQSGNDDMKNKTQEHLNKFAGEGLRTLCLAIRDVDEAYFEDWKERHHEASVTIKSREERLDKLYEEIEQNLTLLGATAIEDKLQDGVPQTIANLAIAGIKIWVLTGDKQETAINIGYSCQLLTDDMVDIFIVDGQNVEDVELQLVKCRESLRGYARTQLQTPVSGISDRGYSSHIAGEMEDMPCGPGLSGIDEDCNTGYALVINGHSLVYALQTKLEKLFLDVGTQCKAVICCRVTPLQKAMVVDLVKKYKQAVTLSIGDGANDVSMIKTAHIGVGISGQEGMQAVLASDYSIAQFRYLERLLLVHGRWSYLRMAKFLRYFFYKNFAFTLCHFWFAFFCGFSAQTVFDPMFISVYNLFYTSLPVLALGIFDQDVNDVNSLKYPKLFTPGHLNLLFNKGEFFKSAMHGCITSCVLFFIPYGAYFYGASQQGHTTSDHQLIGSVVATILVVVVTVQIALDTAYWTVFNHITIWGSLVWYFALQYFYNFVIGGSYVGSLTKAMGEATFWFTLVLSIVILMIPVVAWRFYFVDVHPTLSDRVRLKQRLSAIRAHKSQDFMRTPSARRSRRSLRSGYAFAHQEGFGKLITSGKIMRKTGLNFGSKASSNNAANNNSGSLHNVSSGGGLASTSDQPDGPVSGISYHPTGETNGSMQPSTRQSQNGSGFQQQRPPVVPVVAYSRTSNSNSRQRLQDPYAITVDLESGGDPALPNTMST